MVKVNPVRNLKKENISNGIKKFVVGPIQTNCYIVFDSESKAFVIDPGFPSKEILNFIKKNNLKVEYILITHGHFDHTSFAKELQDETKAKIALSAKEIPLIEGSYHWGGQQMGYETKEFTPDVLLKDGDVLEIGSMKIEVISTPGHSPQGLCFYLEKEKILFSGDTLFAAGVGRTDIPGSNENILWESLMKKVLVLSDETRVLPGHGEETTIKEEQR